MQKKQTNHGVTIGTMARPGMNLDRDGVVTPGRRRGRYSSDHCFHRPRIGALPETLWWLLGASVFDMYVNAGANAAKILQRLSVDMGQQIDVDGGIGAQAIGAG